MLGRLQLICVLTLYCLWVLSLTVSAASELLGVVMMYRHGDRTPIDPYPKDPYRNASYWPEGFGQLTNIGKLQHLDLGQWVRSRYSSFLPIKYFESDIYVRSTDTDRTLMSAEAYLAGLYPPVANQVWDSQLMWQPIPVHSLPRDQDPVLAMQRKCPKYDKMLADLFQTPFFHDISLRNAQLYGYLSAHTGSKIDSLMLLEFLYNNLYIESLYNYTLPAWTEEVYPEKMRPLAELSFATDCFTPELARLKTGLWFNELVTYFKDAAARAPDTKKVMVYSAHDETIANILNSMQAFQYHCPPYASTIIFELRAKEQASNMSNVSSTYVNIFYKNSSNVQNISLKGCSFDCDLSDFKRILAPITLTLAEWKAECKLSVLEFIPYNRIGIIFAGIIFLSLILSIFCIRCFNAKGHKWDKAHDSQYTRLPDSETVY